MERTVKIVIVLVVLGVAGYVAYDQIGKWHQRRLNSALEQEQKEWQGKTAQLEEKLKALQEELEQQKDALVPKEKLAEVFGEEAGMVIPGKKDIPCEELERQLSSLFTYLDTREYITPYNLEGGTRNLVQQMVARLSEKPPVVVEETKDVPSLIRNMAHFYRALGRKQVELVKESMNNETEINESVAATLYAWFVSKERCPEIGKDCPALKVLYEYAAFFLNTLAGKSYLFRRDSKVRFLTTYYCVLIIDQANERTLNQHGIDIRPSIEFLFYELANQRGLIYKKQYAEELTGLKGKYQM